MQLLRTTRAGRATGVPHARRPHARTEVAFGRGQLAEVRGLVAELAEAAGLSRRRTDELVVVVNELAANSVDHGGGHGTVRAWAEREAVVVEVADDGDLARTAEERSLGRAQPRGDAERGRGLWIARHLADDLSIRPADAASGAGTVVRVVQAR